MTAAAGTRRLVLDWFQRTAALARSPTILSADTDLIYDEVGSVGTGDFLSWFCTLHNQFKFWPVRCLVGKSKNFPKTTQLKIIMIAGEYLARKQE